MIIDKRDYYNHGAIEAIDAIESACTGLSGYEGFLTGTVLKYMFRWRSALRARRMPETSQSSSRARWLAILCSALSCEAFAD